MGGLIWEGVLYGLVLSAMMGPIFITLTQSALQYGFRAGMSVGAGIWSSDILVVVLSWLAVGQFKSDEMPENLKDYLAVIGGVILMIFGVVIFFKRLPKQTELTIKFKAKSFPGFWLKGFLVNTVNPFTFIFWLGVISTSSMSRGMEDTQVWILAASIIATIAVVDTIKSFLAKLIRSKMRQVHILWANRIAGVGLFGFGIYLILIGF
jgi:threonine/homoserine/homoserine lactone efflux protein